MKVIILIKNKLDFITIFNKNKITILDWTSILIDAYENVDLLSSEQQVKLDNIYNKVLKL